MLLLITSGKIKAIVPLASLGYDIIKGILLAQRIRFNVKAKKKSKKKRHTCSYKNFRDGELLYLSTFSLEHYGQKFC